jgi:hypothetical protein
VLLLLIGLPLWVVFVGSGGCAAGPPGLNPKDLSEATVTVTNSPGQASRTISIDLANPQKRDALIAAYRSMKKWRQEISSFDPRPDYSLELEFKDGHRLVVVLARSGWPYGFIKKFKRDKLEATVYVDPQEMQAYLFAEGG